MTAEIGVLNINGVVLAADSALTMGNIENFKIFNSGNKIFTLGSNHSVGIMIFGNIDFMGIPWEVIVKGFKNKIGDKPLDEMQDYCTEFFNYVANMDEIYSPIQSEILILGYAESVKSILENTTYEMTSEKFNLKDYQDAVQSNIPGLLKESEKLKSITKKITVKAFTDAYGSKIDVVFQELFDTIFLGTDIYNKVKLSLYKIIRNYFYSDSYFPEIYTGLVIAGFGEHEIFPSLYQFDIAGVVDRVIKKRLNVISVVSNEDVEGKCSSAIVPFAQQDMVHLLINGIATDLQNDLAEIIKVSFDTFIKEASTKQLFKKSKTDEINKIRSDVEASIFDAFDDVKKQRYTEPVLMIIDSMPKEELATLAETLVNMTAFKRRISLSMETVGGPVDVLLITKGDGTVWVKRKHYFDPDINRKD